MSGFDDLVNTFLPVSTCPLLDSFRHRCVGPRIIGELLNPSTPYFAFFLFSRRARLGHRCKGADCARQHRIWEGVDRNIFHSRYNA